MLKWADLAQQQIGYQEIHLIPSRPQLSLMPLIAEHERHWLYKVDLLDR